MPRHEKDSWTLLAEAYGESGLVLMLGAGVSAGSCLPSWKALLERAAIRCFGKEAAALVGTLAGLGYSFPAIAGAIRAHGLEESAFLEVIREELYRDFPYFRKSESEIRDGLVDFVRKGNSTLRAVAALCVLSNREDRETGGHRPFRANPRIRAIVNFNLDAVLRVYSEFRYERRILRTIERASASPSASKINTYHVHGYLHFARNKIGNAGRETDKIVFTEGEYYDSFGAPFSVFSYTVLHLLRENHCCFVGLSMTDENLRRLLHYSCSERMAGYRSAGRKGARARSRRHFAILRRYGERGVDEVIEKSLGSLGVRVAWVEDHKELPERIGRIYEMPSVSGQGSAMAWSEVY